MTVKEGCDSAKVLATYDSSYYAGEPALIENTFGKGRVLHLGSTFNENNLNVLFRYLGVKNTVKEIGDIPEDIEAVVRTKNGTDYLFLLNYMFEPQSAILTKEVTDMYTGKTAYGFTILKKQAQGLLFCIFKII